MNEKLLKIINHYGINHQLRKFNEECFELIEAIRNHEEQRAICEITCSKIHTEKAKEFIKEEIADCLNLINQFVLYFNLEDNDIYDICKFKTERQLSRMEEE